MQRPNNFLALTPKIARRKLPAYSLYVYCLILITHFCLHSIYQQLFVLRISWGRPTTQHEIPHAISVFDKDNAGAAVGHSPCYSSFAVFKIRSHRLRYVVARSLGCSYVKFPNFYVPYVLSYVTQTCYSLVMFGSLSSLHCFVMCYAYVCI